MFSNNMMNNMMKSQVQTRSMVRSRKHDNEIDDSQKDGNKIMLRDTGDNRMNNTFMNNLMMTSTVTNMLTRSVMMNEVELHRPVATIVIEDDDDNRIINNKVDEHSGNKTMDNNSQANGTSGIIGNSIDQTINTTTTKRRYIRRNTKQLSSEDTTTIQLRNNVNMNTSNLITQDIDKTIADEDNDNIRHQSHTTRKSTIKEVIPDDSSWIGSKNLTSTTKMSTPPGEDSDSDYTGMESESDGIRRNHRRTVRGRKKANGQQRRNQWRESELMAARRVRQLWSAGQIGRVDMDTTQARDNGKVVMPSMTIFDKANKKVNESNDTGNRKDKKFIEFNDLKVPNLKEKIIFGEKNIQRHTTKVANLCYTVLSKIDSLIYNETGTIDWHAVNYLWELLMGIPQSILNKLREKDKDNDYHHNTDDDKSDDLVDNKSKVKSGKVIQEQSLYSVEMKDSDIPGNAGSSSSSKLTMSKQVLKGKAKESMMIDDPKASKDMYLDLSKDNTYIRELESYLDESKIERSRIITDNGNTIRVNVGRLINIKNSEILRADKKICKNNISSASNILLNAPTIINNNIVDIYDAEEAYDRLLELHFYHEDDKLPTISEDNNENTIIVESVVDFKKLINSLNRRSAEDIYGWSAELLFRVCKEKEIVITTLMRVINAFMIYNFYPESIFKCRMIAIPKRNKAGAYRPISIPGVFRKLISKVMMKYYSHDMKKDLAKYQLGVGTPFSSETIITTIQDTIDACIVNSDNACIVQLDLSNAYNRVDRNKLIQWMIDREYKLPVIQYIHSMFDKEKLIFYKDNIPKEISNNRGVAQGEIMSPLLFSLYLSDAMKDTQRVADEYIYNNNSSTSSSSITDNTVIKNGVPHIMSYLDDIFIIAPNTEIGSLMTANIVNRLNEKNMITNFDKCNSMVINNGKIYTESKLNIPMDRESNMTIATSCKLKVLGTMISLNQEDVDNYFINKANDTVRILMRSIHLHYQTFLLLVRMCISSRLIHLTKTMKISNKLITDFDQIVQNIITSNFNVNSNSSLIPMINKPFSLGGTSIISLINSMKSLRASLINELNKISHIHNLNKVILSKEDIYNYKLTGMMSNISELSHIITQDNITSHSDIKVNSHDIWLKQSQQEIDQMMIDNAMMKQSNTTLLEGLSKDNNTSKWLQTIPYFPYQKIDNETFVNSMKYRLGENDDTLDYIRNLPEIIYTKNYNSNQCPLCGNPKDEYHYSCCQATGPMRTSRHNIVKKLLAKLLNQNPNISVNIEEKIEDVKGFIPDIVVMYLANDNTQTKLETKYKMKRNPDTPRIVKFGIDLTISEIHARNNLSLTKKGYYANLGEQKKFKHYKRFNEMNDVKVIPFGMSSVGGLGECANDILEFIRETNPNDSIREDINKFEECSSILIESVRYKMKQVYIDTINDRMKRIQMSKPKIGTNVKDTVTIPMNNSSKVNFHSNSSYWNKELEMQRKLDILNSPPALIDNNDKIKDDKMLPWVKKERRNELYNSDERDRLMNIRDDNSDFVSESESNTDKDERWNTSRRMFKRSLRHNRLYSKSMIDNDTDYKEIDSNTDNEIDITSDIRCDTSNDNRKEIDKDIYKDSATKDIDITLNDKTIYTDTEHKDITTDTYIGNSDKEIYNVRSEENIYIGNSDKDIYNVSSNIYKESSQDIYNVRSENDVYKTSSIDIYNHSSNSNIYNNRNDIYNNSSSSNIYNSNIHHDIYNVTSNNDTIYNNSNTTIYNNTNSNIYNSTDIHSIDSDNNNSIHDNIEHSSDPPNNNIDTHITEDDSEYEQEGDDMSEDNNDNNTNNNDSQSTSPITVGQTLNTTSTEQESTSDNIVSTAKSKARKPFIARSYELRSKTETTRGPYNLRPRR